MEDANWSFEICFPPLDGGTIEKMESKHYRSECNIDESTQQLAVDFIPKHSSSSLIWPKQIAQNKPIIINIKVDGKNIVSITITNPQFETVPDSENKVLKVETMTMKTIINVYQKITTHQFTIEFLCNALDMEKVYKANK